MDGLVVGPSGDFLPNLNQRVDNRFPRYTHQTQGRIEQGVLITEPMEHVRSVSVGIWLRSGSRREPAALNGITHFIEHMVFKGTERRSAEEIARVVDGVGGMLDAFTAKEMTCFNVKVLDVQTLNVKGKNKGGLKTPGRRSDWKKAYVTLAEGQTIDFAQGAKV